MNWKVGASVAMAVTLMFGGTSVVNAQTINNGSSIFDVSVSNSFDEEQALTYSRVVCLKHSGNANGTLLATCDQHVWVNNEQVWPIYQSTDGGNSWRHITDITDETFGTNRKAQPMLYELPNAVGDMPAGTLILAGNLVPDDESSSRIVIYKSTDHGANWSYLSTVDQGGPFTYDRSPESTTSTIWEPYLYTDAYGHLVCGYSDERQKNEGALQTLSLKYTSDGINWSSESNIVAIGNKNDRPGMVTVSQMGNGKYIASYEVVNRPSYDQNSSVVYCKFSDDGINWNASDLGVLVKTSDGQCLGSSPYVKWVNAGGPNGMVIIGAKWVVNSDGDIQEGGQNVFVNYNYGEGDWERYPQPLTWNGEDITYLDAFSQCLETNEDDTVLYQIANIGDPNNKTSSLKISSMPLDVDFYEAENAELNNVQVIDCEDSSNKKEVGYINYSDSQISFNKIMAPADGHYTVYVRYNNGTGKDSSHTATINNTVTKTVKYPATPDWHQYYWSSFGCDLKKGNNTISLKYRKGYAEIDCIALYKSDNSLGKDFVLQNRNSSMVAEVPSMSLKNGEEVQQYDTTNYPCQIWSIVSKDKGINLINKNSALALDIKDGSAEDGAVAIQSKENNIASQFWSLKSTSEGYYNIINNNSGKNLEVFNNSSELKAPIGQWGSTGYGCQEWKLVREGMR